MTIPRILIIAGSDSGGGAGIQADIKTVTMLGGYAMTAVTAVTAQNTLGVEAIHPIPSDMVLAQIDACMSDIGIDAIKIGMVGDAATAAALAVRLADAHVPIVFDPVMVATSGAPLATPETIAAYGQVMRIATVTTPNLPELAALASGDDPVAAALSLVGEYGCAVLVKGGHESGDALVDALIEEDNMTSWQGGRIATKHTHGTGCTLGSAIAFHLGMGCSLAEAVDRARTFVRLAIHDAPGLGTGNGPLGHGSVRLDLGAAPRFNHVAIGCSDYAASVAFYTLIGFRQIVDSAPDYARFEAPGGMTLSLHRTDKPQDEGETTLYFECDALNDEVLRLSRADVPFDQSPVDQPWMWSEARLRDPYGNMLCLYRAGEMRRYPPWRVG